MLDSKKIRDIFRVQDLPLDHILKKNSNISEKELLQFLLKNNNLAMQHLNKQYTVRLKSYRC